MDKTDSFALRFKERAQFHARPQRTTIIAPYYSAKIQFQQQPLFVHHDQDK